LLGILLVNVVPDHEPQFSVVVLDVKALHFDVLQGPRHYLVELCEVPIPLKEYLFLVINEMVLLTNESDLKIM
jgi:hypothetical protein